MALGAFLAGLVFADTEFRHQIEADIEPFKGLFLGLFFLSVGMTIDLTVVADTPIALLAAIFGIMAIKAAIFFPIALAMRLPLPIAAEGALLLSQIGEFALIGVGLALTLGLVPPDVARVLVVAAGASMAVTLIIAPAAERLYHYLERRRTVHDVDLGIDERHDLTDHVIVAGYGRVGRLIGELLSAQKAAFIAMEFDPKIVAPIRKAGFPVYYGDIRRADVLRHAGIDRAAAVILTMNNPTGNEHVVSVIRRQGYTLPIVVRARDSDHAKELYSLGADAVVLETLEASLQLGEIMFRALGLPDEAARTIITERREAERTLLEQAARLSKRRDAT
jgi:CPA2 family monovalent cation:H+ antiporter-2